MTTSHEALLIELGIIARALSVLAVKRADYSGALDPYRNFRVIENVFDGTAGKPAVGAVTRLLDKVARVGRAAETGGVRGESLFENDLPDIINYTGIIAGLLLEASGPDGDAERSRLMADGERLHEILQRLGSNDRDRQAVLHGALRPHGNDPACGG